MFEKGGTGLRKMFLLLLAISIITKGISELQSCNSTLCIQHGGHCMNNITVGNNCTCLGVINCTVPITDCSCSTDNNPCYNGTCWDSNDWDSNDCAKCNCTDGWSGCYCDIDEDYCPDSYCQPHGVCVEGLGTEYHCTCEETYRGKLCDELYCPVDYCYNNGACSLNGTSVSCICMIGYYGDRCENEVMHCEESMCTGGGHDGCISDGNNNCICFGILNCTVPITNCSMSDSYLSCPYGECFNSIVENTIKCDNCTSGFKGDYCHIDVIYCFSISCNHGVCIDGFGDYAECVCDEFYEGEECDECVCPEGYCLNGGTCITTESVCPTCSCTFGYTGPRCEEYISFCLVNQCAPHGNCIDLGGGELYCNCSKGYINDTNLTDSCVLDPDMCDPNPCINNGTCENITATDFECNCTAGFGGECCQLDTLDMCNQTNPMCLNGGTCIDQSGTNYECICPEGYGGDNCEKDTDYCESLSPNLCSDCIENIGNSVTCGSCPKICDCKLCSCKPKYCSDYEEEYIGEQENIMYVIAETNNVTISCNCISPSAIMITTSTIIPTISSDTTADPSSTISMSTTSPSDNTTSQIDCSLALSFVYGFVGVLILLIVLIVLIVASIIFTVLRSKLSQNS